MELLNLSFLFLLLKVGLCTVLGVLAIIFIFGKERMKRRLRDRVCFYLFGFHKAIVFKEFNKVLKIFGVSFALLDGLFFWILFIKY
jgi:hypothetical protein